MKRLFYKTFGGLLPYFYFRQLFFGSLIPAIIFFFAHKAQKTIPLEMVAYMAVNTLLYPYSRFVYNIVVDFIRGENVFFVNGLLLLIWTVFVIITCWSMAIVLAPIGLIGIYIHHTRAEKKRSTE